MSVLVQRPLVRGERRVDGELRCVEDVDPVQTYIPDVPNAAADGATRRPRRSNNSSGSRTPGSRSNPLDSLIPEFGTNSCRRGDLRE